MRFASDVAFGLRILRRRPGVSALAIATLALAIGANASVFSVINQVLLQPLPYENTEQIDTIWTYYSKFDRTQSRISAPELLDLRGRTDSYSHVAAHTDAAANLLGTDKPVRIRASLMTANMFDLLGVAPLLGRTFTEAEETAGQELVVVISYEFWQSRLGGDPNVLGRTLMLQRTPHEVVGVMPRGFEFPAGDPRPVWAPLVLDTTAEQRGNHGLKVLARRKPGVTAEAAMAQLAALAGHLRAEYPVFYADSVGFELRRVALDDHVRGDLPALLWPLFAAVLLVLLIGCANVANLLLAQGTARAHELALRVALGARRRRVFGQLLTESLVLAVFGGVLGVLLAWWGVELFASLSPDPRIAAGVQLDARVGVFAACLSLGTTLLFGVVPALESSRADLSAIIKDAGGRTSGSSRGHRLRRALVVAEVGLALVLLAGSGLMVRSFLRAASVDLGMSADGVYTFEMAAEGPRYWNSEATATALADRVVEGLGATPGVEAVAISEHMPLKGAGPSGSYVIEADDAPFGDGSQQAVGRLRIERPDLIGEAQRRTVSSEYFAVLDIPLLEGRTFDPRDTKSTKSVVVIDDLLRRTHWKDGESPIGTRINLFGGNHEIIGVVGHVRDDQIELSDRPQVYLAFRQYPGWSYGVVAKSRAARMPERARDVLAAIDPEIPLYDEAMLSDRVDDVLARRQFATVLFIAFAAIAIVLAGIGIYGVMANSVAERTREIAIRIALGARPRRVRAMVVRQGLALAAVGLAVGFAGVLAVNRAIGGLLYQVEVYDPATLLTVAAFVAAVAAIATFMPARRAARQDPGVALRAD